MTEKQLREERRALLTWFATRCEKNHSAQWAANVDRLSKVSGALYELTRNPIYKPRDL